VARTPLPPIAAALSFVDCINRGDLDGLAALMTPDHCLTVLAESPLPGREANVDAWRGYFTSFPEYVISPRHLAAEDGCVAILGTTTGSHLGLPDEDEERITVIWVADVRDGRLATWRIVEDTPAARADLGLPAR
jgi:ketosteroid isomerase-like protein